MLKEKFTSTRSFKTRNIQSDLAVAGGGMSGICCAIAAARAGIKVCLLHDRPILGGSASSEIRLWIQGATAHMKSNNRWAREGGVIDEILVENLYRNQEGNPIIFDTILLEMVMAEPNITLLLNTTLFEVEKSRESTINNVQALCGENSTIYQVQATLYCDATGEGTLSYLSGASFRLGIEDRDEFNENIAQETTSDELAGHSIYFYTRDTGKPVTFEAPSYAIYNSDPIPSFKQYDLNMQGCRLWWVEYGNRLNDLRDAELIKWERWKIVYAVWDHIKNSGQYPDTLNATLEWVGTIPNKKESRRIEGKYILNEKDIFEQTFFEDAVSYGGWPVDLHPSDGIFSKTSHFNQVHTPGLYQIPFRCLVSKDIDNLLLAGKIISATYIASSSLKVMATCAQNGQAVGIAAALSIKEQLPLAAFTGGKPLQLLQKELVKTGQYIPGLQLNDMLDINFSCEVNSSSNFMLKSLPPDGSWEEISTDICQMLPMEPGTIPPIRFSISSKASTELEVQLNISEKRLNHNPNTNLETQSIALEKGEQTLAINFMSMLERPGYIYICFSKNKDVKIKTSLTRVTGLLSLKKQEGIVSVGANGKKFAVWSPRKQGGSNLAFSLQRGLEVFPAGELRNGVTRPVIMPNAWVASLDDKSPQITLTWEKPQTIRKIRLLFDADFDNSLESILTYHPENISPYCVRNYRIHDDKGVLVYEKKGNYKTRNILNFIETPLRTSKLLFSFEHPAKNVPAAIFEIRCYEN